MLFTVTALPLFVRIRSGLFATISVGYFSWAFAWISDDVLAKEMHVHCADDRGADDVRRVRARCATNDHLISRQTERFDGKEECED